MYSIPQRRTTPEQMEISQALHDVRAVDSTSPGPEKADPIRGKATFRDREHTGPDPATLVPENRRGWDTTNVPRWRQWFSRPKESGRKDRK